MKSYSDLIDRVFISEGLFEVLVPREPINRPLLARIIAADDAQLAGGKTIVDPALFALVRGGLFYALDALEQCHAIFQNAHSDLGSYWHGMMHRREADFENARYWFRRAGVIPSFDEMHAAAAQYSPDMARQMNWDPFLFVGQCEQERFGAPELTKEMRELQRVEFEALFDYCWRQSIQK